MTVYSVTNINYYWTEMFEVEAGFLSTPNLDSTILNSEYLVCDEYSHISEIKLSKEYGKQTIVQMYALL